MKHQDEVFSTVSGKYRSATPRMHTQAARSGLLRWVWVVTVRCIETQTRQFFGAMVTDDFGNLVEVKYIHASVAGSKAAT